MKLICASSILAVISAATCQAAKVECTAQLIQACTEAGCETTPDTQFYTFDFSSGETISCILEDGNPKCTSYTGAFADVTDRGKFGTMEADGVIVAMIRYDPDKHKFTLTTPRSTEVRTAFGQCAEERP